jgi:replicative DNA helicase
MAREQRPQKKPPIPDVAGRPPPSDPDTERTVLATVMLIPLALFKVANTLKSEHFFSEQNQLVYEAILAVLHAHRPVDAVTVKAELRATNKLERAGGAAYLGEITTGATEGAHIETYVERLFDLWRRREYQRLSSEGRALSWDAPDLHTFLAERQREIAKIALPKGRGPERIERSIVQSVSDAEQRRSGTAVRRHTPTGYRTLDDYTGGIGDEDLWVLAGRPGSGKTSLALGIGRNIATPPPPDLPLHIPEYGVILFEMEMPAIQIASRMICMDAGVSFTKWRDGQIGDEEWTEAQLRAGHLRGLNLWIECASDLSMFDIESRTRAIKSEWDRSALYEPCPQCHVSPLEHEPTINRWFCRRCSPDPKSADAATFDRRVQLTRERRVSTAIIDNMSLLRATERLREREEEVSEMSKHAKNMAKKEDGGLDMGVVMLVHLNRAIEGTARKGKDKKPKQSDLRGSGATENNADVIIFPWRPGYYQPGNTKIQHEAQLIIAKQRNGPPGELDVYYEPTCSRFDDPHDGLPAGL